MTLLLTACMAVSALAQTVVYDKSRQRQWQAMELGEIDFHPKEYYRIMHGEPEALNLWMGDSYAVYDHNWHWRGFHSGWSWDFNADKSTAVNLAPKRLAALAEFYLTDKQYEEMMDTINHQVQRELSRAADCEIDKYYEAKEHLPENLEFMRINNKETLAQVFTDIRYTRKDNETMSEGLIYALKHQGFLLWTVRGF